MSAVGLAPLALVGMASRVPGGSDVDELWETLSAGRPKFGPVPAERLSGYDEQTVGTGGLTAALMSDVDTFDAEFFDVGPRLAVWMDPQQRLLLETSWHAMESAGIPPGSLAGQDVGVFVASATSDFRDSTVRSGTMDRYSMVGSVTTYLANRLSYQYDFRGPSMTVDTACSSGLSALSLAASGLRAGEIDAALVGASNVCIGGWFSSALSYLGALSPTGRSRPFAADADGYVRGEGVVCFVLKRLDDALDAGDPVLAVVRGVAANHDGRCGGPVKTDPGSQARLLRKTLAQGGIDPASLGYLEAHATGTKMDGAELEGLRELCRGRAGGPPGRFAGPAGNLWIGSVKSVLGHLEGAAGAVSLAKAVLILRHEEIPASGGILAMEPDLEVRAQEPDTAAPALHWPGSASSPRRLGVSSFGLGGSNGHVVLEEAPAQATGHGSPSPVESLLPVPLSATDAESLTRVANRLADFLDSAKPDEFAAIAWTLQTGREHLAHRRVVPASSLDELRAGLRSLASGEPVRELQDCDGWLEGGTFDWRRLWHRPPERRVTLPGYPFRRTSLGFVPRQPQTGRS
ncbi:polyketide synthase [Amycolatopsis nigrescens]|uniref:polyketide synthase n=1 Tax=Amycolatopsis nigrescens TaxID=381445 RepID=UPI00036C3B3F|nr:polyketide synthase [Amycolatopsis nigrescens]